MNKTELINAMSEKAGISKKDAEAALKAFTDIVSSELQNGRKVQLIGFGNFETIKRNSRTGINPQTGQKQLIPSSITPKFKPSKVLKDLVNL